jgi:preprotein translocase subunit SecD
MKIILIFIVIVLTIGATTATTIEFSEVCSEETPNSHSILLKHNDQNMVLFIKNQPLVTEKDIQSAFYFKDNYASGISITLFPESGKQFDDSIKDLKNHQIAIIINGKAISAPTLYETHFNGKLQITGNLSDEEAKKIAIDLNSKKTEQGAAANP